MEESYFEPGEGVHYPVGVEQSSGSGSKKYPSFLAWQADQPKRAPEPPPKPRPTMGDYYRQMEQARTTHKEAMADKEARQKESLLCQQELSKLEAQRQDLEKQKASAIESGDKKRLIDFNSDIEIVQYQAEKIKTQMADLQQGEDVESLLTRAREAERKFYAQVLDDYKKQITTGTCNMPFSELLTRAYALGCRIGVGNISDYLFQWVHIPTLAGPDVEGILKGIEEELQSEGKDE